MINKQASVGWALVAHASMPQGSLKPRGHKCPPYIPKKQPAL